MAEGVGNIIEVFKAIPAGKRISFLITFVIVVGGFVALLTYTNRPNYMALFTDMDLAEASKVVEKLKEKGVKYTTSDGGSTIKVPDDKFNEMKMYMAAEGIVTKGGTVGFEIFDDISFGTTEFVQKVKYRQAMEGELARAIREFDTIDNAIVKIVAAGDSLFAEEERPATASVLVRLHAGRKLTPRQLQGIINLVSGSVEGLKPENVSIVDMAGGILTKGSGKDGMGEISNDQFEYQRRLEETYEKQIISMLEPVVGINNVVAKVSVDVDYKRVNQTEENYDPDSQVIVSEVRQKESNTDGSKIAQGSPDLLNQGVQTGSELSGTASNLYEKESSTINYKINKLNRQTINESGKIQRLSASVIIDGPYETTDGEKTFKGYSRKEKKTFEDMVKNAIGFDSERGDQVTVSNDVPFSMSEESMMEIPAAGSEGWIEYLKKMSKPILNIVIIALFFLIAIKPFKKWLNQTSEFVSTRALSQGSATTEMTPADAGERYERQNEKLKLLEATKQNPDIAADIIKTWLNEVS